MLRSRFWRPTTHGLRRQEGKIVKGTQETMDPIIMLSFFSLFVCVRMHLCVCVSFCDSVSVSVHVLQLTPLTHPPIHRHTHARPFPILAFHICLHSILFLSSFFSSYFLILLLPAQSAPRCACVRSIHSKRRSN